MQYKKIDAKVFNIYRSKFKGDKISVLENCMNTIPIQHIIVNANNQVLDIVLLNKSWEQLQNNYEDDYFRFYYNIEDAQKELDRIKAKKLKKEQYFQKAESRAKKQRELKEQKELAEAPTKNTLANVAIIKPLKK